ncbi:MAG: ABC transporter substrate-binding protein [Candidatus Hodarchaeales archaeon]|jgi:ABC-type transport system substrate-binding protein
MGKIRILTLGTALTVMALVCFSTAVATPMSLASTTLWASDFKPHGAYIDELVFTVFTTSEIPQAMLALQAGDQDAYDERVLSSYLPNLVNDPDIEVRYSLGSSYRVLVLNSQKFPINITGFRRAMAFGMDKYRVNTEAIGGAGIPLDSYVPVVATEWQVEDQLPTHFYEKDIVSGNASLEASGFRDLDGDGFREYDADMSGTMTAGDLDDDDPMMQVELWPTLEYGPAIAATSVTAEGMEEMGLHATVVEKDWNTLVNAIENGDHWVACWTENIPVVNPTKVLYDYYRTGTPENVLYYRFSNATIDAVLDQMSAASNQEDVKTYARQATLMLAYEQPLIVCYNDANINAYRTDKFEGYFEYAGLGVSNGGNSYVATKVRLKDGDHMGGVFHYILSETLDTTSTILVSTGYEETVMQYIYESLWNIDPNTWDPIPGLAYDWDIEATSAGVGETWMQDGQKFTFNLYDNVTWHDGTAFTSEDVKYSFDTVWPQSPQRTSEMDDVYNVTTPDDYTVELYVNKTGYFEWAAVTSGVHIVPKHIWTAGEADFTTFIPTDAQMVGTGPFYWNTYVPGEYISMLRYDDWRWDIRETIEDTTTDDTDTETTTTTDDDGSAPGFGLFAAIAIISVSAVYSKRRRK